MMRFLRRIRQRLLVKSQFSQYLLYSLGEILLIVIGILIALKVSNLNEQGNTKAREQQYLLAVKNELISNLDVIRAEQSRLERALEAQRALIEIIGAGSDTISEQYLSTLIVRSFSVEIILDYQQGVFNQLISTGGLSDILNDSIKHEVASWDGKMVGVRKQEEELLFYRNKITQFLVDFGDMKTIFSDPSLSALAEDGKSKKNTSNKHILKSQIFENLLLLYSTLGLVLNENMYPRLEADIHSLLRLVENDLAANR